MTDHDTDTLDRETECSGLPTPPPPAWRSIVTDGVVRLPHKGERVRIRALAEWVSLAGMQSKMGLGWLPCEGEVTGVHGVAATRADFEAHRWSAVEFAVHTDAGVDEVRSLPLNALACVEVLA